MNAPRSVCPINLTLEALGDRWLGRRPRNRRSSQQWSAFVRNYADAMLACDFFVAITARFRTLYGFVVRAGE